MAAARLAPALKGELAEIMRAPRSDAALARARAWHLKDPGDVLALVGLGEVLEARGRARVGRPHATARSSICSPAAPTCAGSPASASSGSAIARARSRSTPTAAPSRSAPITPPSHRLCAYALLRAGKPAEAFAAIVAGLDRRYPAGQFLGADRVARARTPA